MHLPSIATKWFQARLLGDATLLASAPGGVHRDLAESDTATPYVVWSEEDGDPFNTAGGQSHLTVPLTLQVIDDDNAVPTDLESALARLSELLMPNGETLRVTFEGVSIRVVPGSTFSYPEPIEGGRVMRHRGAQWLLYLSRAS
jgi:hypothetical protein